MGDIEGSSNAAQSARYEGNKNGQGGLFRRIISAIKGSPNDQHFDVSPVNGSTPVQAIGMMNLRRMRVEDVATPRAEIVAAQDTITKENLVALFRDSGMSRLPVYTGTLDVPIGLIHLKDFALSNGFNGGSTPFVMKSMLRPLLFVPPSMTIGVLLTKMQTERRHMALVIDEYGGVDGLVTIEDLIEQVIGDIEDEHDIDEAKLWTHERAGTYLALARTPLDEFEAEIGISLTDHAEIDSEEIDTLGGLVFVLAGHVPARGEVVPHPAGFEFEVVDADPRRIKRLRVRLPGTPSIGVAKGLTMPETSVSVAAKAGPA